MKKIVFIMPHVNGKGGTETVLKTVCKFMQNGSYNMDAKLYVLGGSEDKRWLEGINFKETVFSNIRIIRNIQSFFMLYMLLKRFILKEKPDVVVCIHPILCLFISLVRKFTKTHFPIVSWIHFSLNRKNVNKNYLLKSDFHLSISSGIRKQLLSLKIPMSNIYTIYNPINQTNNIIKRPEKKVSFLYIGRVMFEGQKRLKDLLSALAK